MASVGCRGFPFGENKCIGIGEPCFFIAEAGVNHNGDMKIARGLIDAAKQAGADAVKFQTFQADKLCMRDAPKAEYQIVNCGDNGENAETKGETQFQMLDRLSLSAEQHMVLIAYCKQVGIMFLSSPFDEDSVDFLDSVDVPGFKVGSGELTNRIMLEKIAATGKPVILSTGMGTMQEVKSSVRVLQENGCLNKIVVLQCTTQYPTPTEEVNLKAMVSMREELGVPTGFSDHTKDDYAAIASIALGGCVIEKHFTLDQDLPGPDHKASLTVVELTSLINKVRVTEKLLGTGEKKPAKCEIPNIFVARKSLCWKRDVKKGETLSSDMLTSLRPSSGINPMDYPKYIGKVLNCDCYQGMAVEQSHFA